ncbi:cupin-like domain-containing protein [Pseudoalteromonas luteoviolacea]|uniref:cupin-like domain-containing protein n=1 Tax=Pseudoalteromonas luteoviolacea TaxID=43657 RepID=UPI00114F81D1|nr:cupin-like domain-containing protein [Pseudoalteromonas luteoviolacea]TQF71320.1 cupin-like domain-containing protein [Pseudoalteromonas luteoviolacea]
MIIERIKSPSIENFYKDYYHLDKPVILTDAIDSWEAKSLWTPDYFASNFPEVEIKVEAIGEDKASDSNYYVKNLKYMKISMLDYVNSTHAISKYDGRFYAAQLPITEVIPQTKSQINTFPYWSKFLYKLSSQKALFWMGPAGCKSALHFDDAPNLNVQLYGKKRWVIYPKSEYENLYLPSTLEFPHFSPINMDAPDFERFPKFRNAKPIEFVLEPGETLFLPQSWAHYVETIEYSISLNFWWTTWKHVIDTPKELWMDFVGKFK